MFSQIFCTEFGVMRSSNKYLLPKKHLGLRYRDTIHPLRCGASSAHIVA